jgi:methylamine utilization protein MauE
VTVVAAAALGAASLLLLAAGGAKAADPTRTAGALATLGWGVPAAAVRVGAVAEALLGALGLVVGGPVVAALVALSFAGFAVFVGLALASGTPVGTCGCFGRADAPPGARGGRRPVGGRCAPRRRHRSGRAARRPARRLAPRRRRCGRRLRRPHARRHAVGRTSGPCRRRRGVTKFTRPRRHIRNSRSVESVDQTHRRMT